MNIRGNRYMQLGRSRRAGFGRSPALIIVDVARSLTDQASTARVPGAAECINALNKLLHVARERNIPRLFTKNGMNYFTHKGNPFTDPERGSWAFKNEVKDRVADPSMWDIAPELCRRSDEIIIEKTKPSAFFCTPLIAYLTHLGVDTLIIGGMMASGCVRCTVVDAFQYNYRVIVPLEGVADRRPHSIAPTLEDIDLKYGDVMPVRDIVAHLESSTAAS